MLVSDQVFRTLLEALLEGRYAPGEKLPTQRALAADLGVTMSSVREALKRLEQMGLVDVRHGDAMRVRDWREHGGLDVVAHLAVPLGRGGRGRARRRARGARADAARARPAGRAAPRRRRRPQRLVELAARVRRHATTATAAQAIDFAFFAEVAEAARQHRLRPDPQRDPRRLLRARRARAGHRRPARAGAALHAPGGRDRAPRRRRAAATAFALAAQQTAWVREALGAMTAREADIFALPGRHRGRARPMPRSRDTDAGAFFADWLDHAPALNRAGIARAAVRARARAAGRRGGARLRRLDGARRRGGAAAHPRHRVRRRRRRRHRDRAALLLRRRRGDALARLRRRRGDRALPRAPRPGGALVRPTGDAAYRDGTGTFHPAQRRVGRRRRTCTATPRHGRRLRDRRRRRRRVGGQGAGRGRACGWRCSRRARCTTPTTFTARPREMTARAVPRRRPDRDASATRRSCCRSAGRSAARRSINSGTCFRTPAARARAVARPSSASRSSTERRARAVVPARRARAQRRAGAARARRAQRRGRPARRRGARLVGRLPVPQRARLRRLGRVRVRLPDRRPSSTPA